MDVTKNQTQIRAEISWLWQRENAYDVQTDSGAVRFRSYKTDVSDNRIEAVWEQSGVTLDKDASVEYELDYLTRRTVGGTLDIGFLDVRTLLVINYGPGTLVVSPCESCGWKGPWDSVSGVNVVPPGGTILLCAGDAPWKVALLENGLKLLATQDNCKFDVAVVGKIADVPSSDSSSGSSASSGSSSSSESSGSSGSSESISE